MRMRLSQAAFRFGFSLAAAGSALMTLQVPLEQALIVYKLFLKLSDQDARFV